MKNIAESKNGAGLTIRASEEICDNSPNNKKALAGVLTGLLLATGLVFKAPDVIDKYSLNSTYELPKTSLADVIGKHPVALNGTLVLGPGVQTYLGFNGITSNSGYDQGYSTPVPEGKSLVISRPIFTVDSEGNEFYFGKLDGLDGQWLRVSSSTEGLNYISPPEGQSESKGVYINGNVATDRSGYTQFGRTSYISIDELNG